MIFTQKELERLTAFYDAHYICYKKLENKRAKFKIKLEATGLGDAIEIKCCCCKKVENVSDYESW